jgi:hypothetical protein
MEQRANKMRYDTENYEHVHFRSIDDTRLVKERCKELKRIFENYQETSKKQEIIIEVLERETGDIETGVEKARSILLKKQELNRSKLEEKREKLRKIGIKIDEGEAAKKEQHKEMLV